MGYDAQMMNPAWRAAVEKGDLGAVQEALDSGADPVEISILAIEIGRSEVVDLAFPPERTAPELDAGLKAAVKSGDAAAVAEALSSGASPSSILLEASSWNRPEIVDTCLAAGADIEARSAFVQETPLMKAPPTPPRSSSTGCSERVPISGPGPRPE